MGRLIIDGSNVYEIDEKCIKNHRVDSKCGVLEKLMESDKYAYQPGNEQAPDSKSVRKRTI